MAVYGYVRVSTDKQEMGLAAQKERIEKYCAFRGLESPTVSADEDVSGSIPIAKRPQGGALCSALRRGDVVVAMRLDRCFRDAADGINTLFAWQAKGINLHLADQAIVADTSTAAGFLCIAMQLVVAQYERLITGERTSQALRTAQKAGKRVTRADRIPYGFRADPNDPEKIIADEVERAFVFRVQSLPDDMSFAEMAEVVKDFRIRGKTPTRHMIRRILDCA